MYFVYSFFIHGIYLFIPLLALWNKKAKQWLEGQQKTQQFIHDFPHHSSAKSPLYWFHCASLGEFEQARPLLEEIKEQNPSIRILLTFFSPSGYEIRKNYPLATYVLYLPLDSPLFLNPFLDTLQPTALFLAKYDFWPNLIALAHKRAIPILAFSTKFRSNQIYFRWYGSFFRQTLKKITFLFTQDQKSVDLLHKISISHASFVGDTRLDRVVKIAAHPQTFPRLTASNARFFIAGSIWEKDFQIIRPLIHSLHTLHYILVPHDIEETQIQRWQQELSPLPVARWSDWCTKKDVALPKILIVDTVGILSSLYSVASFAYIGGTWDKGLHNTLEAAVYGVPLFFGAKKYHFFQEAIDLIALQAACPIHDSDELETSLNRLLHSSDPYKSVATTAQKYVYQRTGATDKILKIIKNMALIP